MDKNQTVLLVGATGTMGVKVAEALAVKSGISVRALVRETEPSTPKRRSLESLGFTIFPGSLEDEESLGRAAEGVATVISTVQGGPDVIVDGQLRLLRAAENGGATRFFPSDFSGDYNHIAYGDNYNYDPRKKFAELAANSRVTVTHLMIGAFTEVFFAPFIGIFDFDRMTAEYWGTECARKSGVKRLFGVV